MKKIFLLFLLAISSTVVGQSKLPSCQGTDTDTWNMCFGTLTNPDGRKYVGEWKDGTPYGIGTGTRSNGRTYVGEFKDGKYNGQGTITFPGGDKYVGEFKEGQFNGQVTATFANGDKYVGEYKDGKRDGKGTLTLLSGAKYVGEWKDDERTGQGTWTSSDGEKYVGQWKNHKYHGQGTVTLPDGSKYVGEFKDGEYHGQGIRTYSDGSKYVGEWKRGDEYHGQGTQMFSDGSKYVGEWKNGRFSGQGTSPLLDGSKYVGEYKDDKFNGQGTFTFADGSKYVGEWKNDEINGLGTYTYANGNQYVGEWKNSKRHGLGKMNYAGENKKYGQWIEDRFVDSKDTKISLYKSFSKNERFRPVEIIIPSDVDCEDIKRSTLKKLIFDQLAYDGESIESLCALDNKINRRCLNEDKKIYTEKWREFTSKSKISMSESFTKSVNKNIEICEVDVSISFRFDEVKASRLLLSIDKKSSRKTILSVDAVRWIELSTQSTDILRITIDQFRRMLLLSGEFDAQKSSFKFDPMTKKVYLYDILRLEDFHEEHDAANPYFIFNKKLELYYKQ